MRPALKQAFDLLPGLPPRDDAGTAELMDAVSGLPRENLQEIARSLLRAALATERTGSPQYLECLAEDTLATFRLRRDAGVGRAIREAPAQPAGPGGSVDVEEMLRERGITRGCPAT
jgi:hypothetical protein